MGTLVQQSAFDYAGLPSDDATALRMAAERIRLRLKRTAEDIVAIGQELIEAKKRAGHGRFGEWLAAEFEMHENTALNFMRVADRFADKTTNFVDMPSSVLYLLAAPSTPDEVREQVASGEVAPKVKDVQEAIKAAKKEAKDARQEAEQAKRELWDARTAAGDLDLQRKRAEGEATQAHKQVDLLRRELEELRNAQPAETEPQYIEVVPEDVQQRVRALEAEIRRLEAVREAMAAPDEVDSDRAMLAALARMLRAQLTNDQRRELVRMLDTDQ